MFRHYLCAFALLASFAFTPSAQAATISGSFSGYTLDYHAPIGGTFALDTTTLVKSSKSAVGDEVRWYTGLSSFAYNFKFGGTTYADTYDNISVMLRQLDSSISPDPFAKVANNLLDVQACKGMTYNCVNFSVETLNKPLFSNIEDIGSVSFAYAAAGLVDGAAYSAGRLKIVDVVNKQFRYNFITMTSSPSEVPLPAALPLFGAGLAGLAGISRRKKAIGA